MVMAFCQWCGVLFDSVQQRDQHMQEARDDIIAEVFCRARDAMALLTLEEGLEAPETPTGPP